MHCRMVEDRHERRRALVACAGPFAAIKAVPGLLRTVSWTTFNLISHEPSHGPYDKRLFNTLGGGYPMFDWLFRFIVKAAILLALVRFVIMPMLPGSLGDFHIPSPADLLKDPLKVFRDV